MGRRFAAAWRFLTIFPFPWWCEGDEGAALSCSVVYFPVVGLAVGVLIGLVGEGLIGIFPLSVAAALGVVLLAVVSGGLHLDGLADCADALCSPGHDRERALAVMKDSRVGAHGAMGLFLVLLVKYACLVSIPRGVFSSALLVTPVIGRVAMLFPMVLLPYVRERGLGRLFDAGKSKRVLLVGGIWGVGGMVLFLGEGVVFGVVLLGVVIMGWVWYLRKRLGGATGDAYGAACELGETTFLLAAAASFY